jgi:hypothetical protein
MAPMNLGSLKVDYSLNGDRLSGSFFLENCNRNPPSPTAVPTLSEWGLIIFTAMLGIFACIVLRRRSLKKA